MRAAVFHGVDDIRIEEVPRPHAGPGDAVIRITMTTICGTDLHIVRGEYPVKPGLVIGHEPVGVIEELGVGVSGYALGERVLVGAITPCGQCNACLSGNLSQCGHGSGYEAIGGWRFGNTINGAQAEYLLVPNAQANLAKIPDDVTDEQVVLLADIASTGISGAESGGVRIGDAVAVFALGPIGLCAAIGARLMGAALVIGVDGDDHRIAMARQMGVDVVLDYRTTDVAAEVRRLTGTGVDVSIEALGTQSTFETALRVLRPGGTLSSLGVYSGKLQMPYDAFAAGLGDHRIVTTLCPGGKERMRRLIEMVRSGKLDLRPLITHRFRLADIREAYALFGERRDGVMKVAITP
ncbi:MAG TPA: alcohol dehydrogenase catalytic domain-containing protein [Thermoanaerobaculia bacterium]|jgi:threonine dehydrogenase-like Zn-dependent dehydrogenase|nr:alcohol dehydrogenase catalytic domain-containing protein [Thermoanaerobaculia bacterium]